MRAARSEDCRRHANKAAGTFATGNGLRCIAASEITAAQQFSGMVFGRGTLMTVRLSSPAFSDPDRWEGDRLAALQELDVLDSPREEAFDRITRLVRNIFGVKARVQTQSAF